MGYNHHHLISKGRLRGNKAARAFVEHLPDIFLPWVCGLHNTSRIADTKKARAYMLAQVIRRTGRYTVDVAFEQLRTYFKGPQPELRPEAILWEQG